MWLHISSSGSFHFALEKGSVFPPLKLWGLGSPISGWPQGQRCVRWLHRAGCMVLGRVSKGKACWRASCLPQVLKTQEQPIAAGISNQKLLWSSCLNLRKTNTHYNQWGFESKLLEKLFTEHEMEMWKWKIKNVTHKSIPVDATDFKVFFVSLHSLGVALSRGHGKYFFRGNVTIEEGKVWPWLLLSFGLEEKGLEPTMSGL
jgi:hypothetical protein